jgi:hypothetical protein
VTVFCLAAAAQAAVSPWISYRVDAESPWVVDVNVASGTVLCTHAEHAADAFEIDYDDAADDGCWGGIMPILDGKPMSGLFMGNEAPLLCPAFVLYPDSVSIETDGDVLHIRHEGSSFRSLLNPAGGDEPVFMETAVRYGDDGVHIDLYGLYYILPTVEDTAITMISDGQTIQKQLTADSPAAIEYYPDVTRVEVSDALFGDFYFDTFCMWLQIQVHANDNTGLFEFDFDHTFKDRGQRAVLTKMVIPYPAETTE